MAAEFALVGARQTRLEEFSQAGDSKARQAILAIQSLDRYISATQLGITLASLGLGWIGEPALASLLEVIFGGLQAPFDVIASHSVAVAIAFTFVSSLHIILGELVPKAVALLFPEQVSRWVIYPLTGFAWVMHYPINLLNGTAHLFLKLIGITPSSEHDRLHSPDEIRMLVEQSGEGGSLRQDDARLLEGVFEFSEKTAEEVMTPRTEIAALEITSTLEEAADLVAETGRSRYPVYTDSLDEVVGVVHSKDIFRALRQGTATPLLRIMRTPLFVPGTRDVEDVLADMRRLKTHLAIVLDEYGGTAGLVSMEDLLEEIVGEIYDEHDSGEPASKPDSLDDGAAVLDGSVSISEFNHRFDASLDQNDYTTIGGFVFGLLGQLPKPGDTAASGEWRFEVTEMDGRRVSQIRASREVRPEPGPD